ncbi:MAG: HNH endonuclease [Candidatus Entotheonella factor]|uniref:HNH endonuclease n=1 Tax=Entotheonella factor TaxID=1429438 RepID=W4LD75_ENTF1|nr:MAG: HNH endonuclease [Candidatus Entotheonella factor]
MYIEKDLLQRIYARLDIDEDKMCWRYTGGTNGRGYGRIYHRGKMYGVHRLIYEIFHGPIPKGKEVHHLCAVRSCCNPAHLELVTHRENVARIGRYESLRWERLKLLLGANLDLALLGFTQVTSKDFQKIWGRNFQSGNIASYLETVAFIFGEDFEWNLVPKMQGKRHRSYTIRMSRRLIKRLEAYEDEASQLTLDTLAEALAEPIEG